MFPTTQHPGSSGSPPPPHRHHGPLPVASTIVEDQIHPPGDQNAEARQFALEVSEEEICQRAQERMGRAPHFAYPRERPLVWVKFGDPWRRAEADMQAIAWRWVRAEHQAGRCSPGIHVPEVYRTFTNQRNTFFIIMELVPGTVLAKSAFMTPDLLPGCYDLMAKAIQVLRRMPTPLDATPGPYTPDHSLRLIRHPMFKDQKARIVYPNVEEFEAHINTVIVRSCRKLCSPPPPVALERELVFTYSDFNDENFMFDTDDNGRLRLYLVDFEHTSFLPLSLLAVAVLRNGRWWTTEPIAERIRATLPETNLEGLARASYAFHTLWAGVGLEKKDLRFAPRPRLKG